MWQGYPVLIIATSYANKVFHPCYLAICNGESEDDFASLFKALQRLKPEWQPPILSEDASEAITAGFESVFGPPDVRRLCFFHVLKNVEPYLTFFSPKMVFAVTSRLIHLLQTCPDEVTLKTVVKLFVGKWSAKIVERILNFVQYFEEHWLEKNADRYEGVAIGYPSTNNGLESLTATIKREHTLRERYPGK